MSNSLLAQDVSIPSPIINPNHLITKAFHLFSKILHSNLMASYFYDDMKKDRISEKNTSKISATDRLFRTISIVQICIHLCAYLATFVKLILIEAGGYYDAGVMNFLSITLGSMPLFAIALWLIKNSAKLSDRVRVRGYCFYLGVCIWSIWIIKVSYFMQ